MKKSELIQENLERLLDKCKKVQKKNKDKSEKALNKCVVTLYFSYIDDEFYDMMHFLFPLATVNLAHKKNSKKSVIYFSCKLGDISAISIMQFAVLKEIIAKEEKELDKEE